jgi:NAD+ synthetase
MKIGILQLNFTVGNFEGNAGKILNGYWKCCRDGAELVVGPELAIWGYPPQDQLLRRDRIESQLNSFYNIVSNIGEVPLIIGVAVPNRGNGKPLFNSAAFIQNGGIKHLRHKALLPTYDVFDEARYFKPYLEPQEPIMHNGKKIAVVICEDIWNGNENKLNRKLYGFDPIYEYIIRRSDLFIALNASPWWRNKPWMRHEICASVPKALSDELKKALFGDLTIVYVNQVGGNDELIFDGRSFAQKFSTKEIFYQAKAFKEEVAVWDLNKKNKICFRATPLKDLHDALVLGIKDFIQKCGCFSGGAVIGLSGGIDSSVAAALAVEALGADKVLGLIMPSFFKHSVNEDKKDAILLAKNLGIETKTAAISKIYKTLLKQLRRSGEAECVLRGEKLTVADENLQPRIRGAILMDYSKRLNKIVLATGNKSEIATGYCTLYGDMTGGLAVLSDVYKTDVFRLAEHINRRSGREIIPKKIIQKPPSAGLKPGQKDADSLPPYDVLDQILKLHIEEMLGPEEIIEKGFKKSLVQKIIKMAEKNEFKRRQSAPGLKVSSQAFGSGWRMPIAAKY